ncbi:hypothetical protein KIW84_011177 [Lathyrus oleraceus]|uniref:DUF7745 domain-containing protein n=1 Tax=Pisum sativum TaxID=3888 RepID=A0A9D4YNR1_PEA|nr:hypothetical protein KIW84_011177 [Pisum sativum]
MPKSVPKELHLSADEVKLGLGPRGISRKFLEDKAWALEKEGKWLPFSVVLALFVYGFFLLGVENLNLLQTIKQARTQVHRKGKELGKRDYQAKESYRQWVLQRVKEIKLPYNVDVQVPPPEPEPVYPSKLCAST